MELRERIRERDARQPQHASAFFLPAKLEVMTLARQGRLLTPQEAWRLAGESVGRETLWSIAYRIGTANDVSPQEICTFLEKQFPRYSQTGASGGVTWDDVRY
jgi:hypothetical protein